MGKKPIKPILTDKDGKSYIRSTNFAKVFGRRHDSVLESVRGKLISFQKEGVFLERDYKNSRGQTFPEFLISEEGFNLLTQNYKTEEHGRRKTLDFCFSSVFICLHRREKPTMQTLQEFTQQNGLKTAFVRKCLNSIQLLAPHIHRGEKNKLLLDDDALRIFDRIKELKEEGLSLPDIQKQLDGPVQTGEEADTTHTAKDMQDTVNTQGKDGQTELFTHYQTELDTLRAEREQQQEAQRELSQQFAHERRELEQQLLDLTHKNAVLQGELKALPAGKTPAELRKDYEQEQERRRQAAQIMGELKATTGLLKGKRRKALLQQLETLLS